MRRLFFVILVVTLLSCENHDNQFDNSVLELKGVSFKAQDNSSFLFEDVQCDIIGDTLVECWIPFLLEDKSLKPSIDYNADYCIIDSLLYQQGETLIDFRKPVKFRLFKNEISKEYSLLVHTFTGLPVVWIETKNHAQIESKEDYLEASVKIVEDIVYKESRGIEDTPVLIKGRGHSTWTLYPKKPYRLKFEDKISILDMPKDKAWVLLANYKDITLLRNHIAYWLGSISNLDYTPKFRFVECMLNGKYIGSYQIGEKIKISKHRVNVGDEGFLLEMASNESDDGPHFKTNHIEEPFYIKEPDVNENDEKYCYAKDYLIKAESVLYSGTFTDPITGWRQYLDETSLVDYYLINEIAKCVDAVRWTSTYLNFSKGGKIKMGPIWDFDSAFGNETYDGCDKPENFYTKRFGWYPRLFEDPSFVAEVKKRFDFFYSKRYELMSEIDKSAKILTRSAYENNLKWGVLDVKKHNNQRFEGGGYEKEVEWMKKWITLRLEWLKAEFDKM